ncbi:TonB-dependent receptor [Flagellimonas crocea]|uniref:TonB-dependent receptor n=1 Tax=Flagellimonas crocea TaxID=3067311 RepID=UPI00296F2D6A|nr:TonB-dependent receptor [Muricauda sp. DH64]
MKISLVVLFTITISLQANNSYSQLTKVTLDMESATVAEVIDEIESTTEFTFIFKTTAVNLDHRVSLKFRKANIERVLNKLFATSDTVYEILDRKIILTESPPVRNDDPNPGGEKTPSIQYQVSGTVVDSQNIPLGGANIIEKGTTNGTQADFDGNFELTLSDQNAVLVVSFIGYGRKEIAVNGQSNLTVMLEESAAGLNEVVVVGYGSQRKVDLTGSVVSVATEELEELPVTRTDQALQGRVPGVFIQSTDGSPNGEVNIRIRGSNSLSAGNDPLIVIDGFQGGSLNNLNPNDIESIQVLKDASATAIYGSRGANGVILVTTKTGKIGKPVFTYNTFFSVHTVRRKLDLINAAQYAETVNANRIALGGSAVFSDTEIADYRANGGTDWQDEIFKNGFAQNHVLSISGASDNVDYYISGNVTDQEGIILNTGYTRYSLRSNIKTKLSDKFSVGVNAFLAREENNPTTLNGLNSPIFSAQLFAPVLPVYEEDGTYSQPSGSFGPPTQFNPVGVAQEPINQNISNTVSVNANVEYKIIDDLTLTVRGAYRSIDLENSAYNNQLATNKTQLETASITNQRSMTLQNTNQLTYTPDLGEAHRLTITGVLEQQYERNNGSTAASTDFLTDGVTFNNLALGANPQVPTSFHDERSLLSYVGRLSYAYDDRYSINLTARSDGSSVFGANNKRGFFPSAGFAWNMSNESFLEDSEVVNNFKLRGSYGIIGNQNIDPFLSLARLSTTIAILGNGDPSVGVIQAATAGNPNLKWEQTRQFNVGVDLDLFNNRLNLVADYYNKTTEDLLLFVPLPGTSGVDNILRNIAEVENKGFEFYLGGTPIEAGKFTWDSGFNIAFNRNKVLSLDGDRDEIPVAGVNSLPNFGNVLWLEVGEPIGQMRGFVQNGVWQSSEAAEAATYGSFPGAPKYLDVNNDNQINGDDITLIGSALPDYTFGWNNTFRYGNLDLNVFVQGVQGNDIYNLGRVRSDRTSGDADATGVAILDRWTPQNEDTNVPSFEGTNSQEQLQSTRWLEDGSYIRFKNIALGYSFPSEVLDKLNVSRARLYVSGTNLITFTDYSGYDPESTNQVDTQAGLDTSSYPSQKVITIGVDLSF